uniref:Uncharacterized protein n=1 Tax=Arundo donax TaxID=35708 RepID=A0A0A9E503_ARUDO
MCLHCAHTQSRFS